jgi:hypothetical protein
MRNSNCSNNNNSSVLGTKAGNFTEYGSICSKEEIKETINLYRSGKARENLVRLNNKDLFNFICWFLICFFFLEIDYC